MRRMGVMTLWIAALAVLLCLSGCYWMGKTTGKTVQKIEEGSQSFEEGYGQGRKNSPPPQAKSSKPSSGEVQPKGANQPQTKTPQPQTPIQTQN